MKALSIQLKVKRDRIANASKDPIPNSYTTLIKKNAKA